MRIAMMRYLVLFLSLIFFSAADIDADSRLTRKSIQLWSWPLSETSPKRLAEISYQIQPAGLVSTPSNASVIAYDSSHLSSSSDEYIRVGLYDEKSSAWTGVVTSAATFDPIYNRKITLHTDEEGEVYNCGIVAFSKPKVKRSAAKSRSKKASTKTSTRTAKKPAATKKAKAKTKGSTQSAPEEVDIPLSIELVPVMPGAQPILNKPVVLDAQGNNPADAPQEKSFLQKYWWAIAVVLVLQLFVGGQQEEGGKK